jgi:hypothetical protein
VADGNVTGRVPRWSWAAVCARRLERHALSAPVRPAAAGTDGQAGPDMGAAVADVVGRMCGAHAQIITAAELSAGLRIEGATRADVRDALWRSRTCVKTRGPRGTVHLLPAADLPLWTRALSALPPPDPLPGDAGMTREQCEEVVAAIADALAGAELTVAELTGAIADRVGSWAADPVMDAFQAKWPRWRQMERLASDRGAMCFGPARGRNVTYTSPARWLPGFRPVADPAGDPDAGRDALGELLRRYLWSYGPATPAGFARWLGASKTLAASLLAGLGDRVVPVEVEGDPAWALAEDATPPDPAPDGLRLLPYFDAYTVGCHPRALLFPGPAAARALAGSQAGNFPVLLIDGTVAGVWHQRRSGRRAEVTVEPLVPLRAAQRRALDEQVGRVGKILEVTPRLTVGPVTVGAHA